MICRMKGILKYVGWLIPLQVPISLDSFLSPFHFTRISHSFPYSLNHLFDRLWSVDLVVGYCCFDPRSRSRFRSPSQFPPMRWVWAHACARDLSPSPCIRIAAEAPPVTPECWKRPASGFSTPRTGSQRRWARVTLVLSHHLPTLYNSTPPIRETSSTPLLFLCSTQLRIRGSKGAGKQEKVG